MSTESVRSKKRRIQSKDFRTVAVTTLGMTVTDNISQVVFGIETSHPDDNEEIIEEEVRLLVTPRTLKMFAVIFTEAVTHLEKAMGAEIPVTPNLVGKFKAVQVKKDEAAN